jgi:aspartyl-tRNA(Asn)/glutamyl-tRNA(Gln) amidotransferase subunit A
VIPLSWTFDHVGPLARTVADTAIMLQAIAGYDPTDVSSRQMSIPDYRATLRSKVASLRVGVAREFFFADLDPDIEAATSGALQVLQRLTAGLRDVALPASGQEQLRAAVRAAEAYAYHAESLARSPESYQPETLQRLRAGTDVKTPAYIQGRREVDLTRRKVGKAFETVDVIVTPTTAVPPPLLADVVKDVTTSMAATTRTIRNTSPFNVFGWPTVSVPCGFTRSGLPIGLQISGPSAHDAAVLQVAYAYEQATDWHRRRPPAR